MINLLSVLIALLISFNIFANEIIYFDCKIKTEASSDLINIGKDVSNIYRYNKEDGFRAFRFGDVWEAKFCSTDDDELKCEKIYEDKDIDGNKMVTTILMKLNRFTLDFHYLFQIDKPDIAYFKKTYDVNKGKCKKIDKQEF